MRLSRIGTPKVSVTRVISVRKVVIARRKLARPDNTDAKTWLMKEEQRKLRQKEQEMKQRLRELEKFKTKVQKSYMRKEDKNLVQEIEKDLNIRTDDHNLDSDIDLVFGNLMQSEEQPKSLKSLKGASDARNNIDKSVELFSFPSPNLTLPEKVIHHIGPLVKHISNPENIQWGRLLLDLEKNQGFNGLSSVDITRLIQNIPKEQKYQHMSLIHEMMFNSGISPDRYLTDLMMTAFSEKSYYEPLVEAFFQEYDVNGWAPTDYTFGALIKVYSKGKKLDKINNLLNQMKLKYHKEPNKKIYTMVLQTCMKIDDYKKTSEVFDAMKFNSVATNPDTTAFGSMILMHVLNDNVEAALDLYDNLETEPDETILLALARGCSSRKVLINRGWDFIIEYYKRKFPLNEKLMTVMMYLTSRDGDLSLTRAIYNTIHESRFKMNESFSMNKDDGIALNVLLRGYFKYSDNHTVQSKTNDAVVALRRSTLALNHFGYHPKATPFLPVNELEEKHILPEVKAIWSYIILHYPDIVTSELVGTYLMILATRGSMSEFTKAFEELTLKPVVEQLDNAVEVEEEPEPSSELSDLRSTPLAIRLSSNIQIKYHRNHDIYHIALQACINNKDIEFGQKIWQERGRFRKTPEFSTQPRKIKHNQDFEFARDMLRLLVKCNELNDACKLLLSTETQFNWEWTYVKPVYIAAEQLGDEYAKKVVRRVVRNKKSKWREEYLQGM
ncbi:BA75_03694T0 [Komagataella pastoris]|uniref:BA75_03694T0 n=1 Tax=Komagataella pastoris TaxID=4922 RepID=A0A1B2JGM9_PICPA|nr:BA75_03694T0 [Komagataella pastoris]